VIKQIQEKILNIKRHTFPRDKPDTHQSVAKQADRPAQKGSAAISPADGTYALDLPHSSGEFACYLVYRPVAPQGMVVDRYPPLKQQNIKQTNKQPTNQSINQSVDQSINQWINQSVDQLVNQSINPLINRSNFYVVQVKTVNV
jgi:hypothetical protein